MGGPCVKPIVDTIKASNKSQDFLMSISLFYFACKIQVKSFSN